MAVDFGKIKQQKVRNFMVAQGIHRPEDFGKLHPACFDPMVAESYKIHRESFLVQQGIDHVWNTYKMIHPKEAWNGDMVSFGLQYSRTRNVVSYLDDPYSGMEAGQVIVLNLKLFWGLLNIAVAHEVVEINDTDHTLKLCYMMGGASEGSQWISLRETPQGFTEISHETFYKSNSNFRDHTLYPPLHTKAISEFHHNVRLRAELPEG